MFLFKLKNITHSFFKGFFSSKYPVFGYLPRPRVNTPKNIYLPTGYLPTPHHYQYPLKNLYLFLSSLSER